jgi:hypothetical protein
MGPSRAATATPVLVTMELSPCNFGLIKLSLRNGNGHVGDRISKAGLPAGANSDDTRRATAARLSLHLRQRCRRPWTRLFGDVEQIGRLLGIVSSLRADLGRGNAERAISDLLGQNGALEERVALYS